MPISRRLGTAAVALLLTFAVPAAAAHDRSVGTPRAWPLHNLNVANTRATFDSRIDARNVASLKKRWTFELPYAGPYGSFTSNPIVAGGVVYLEDPDSDVFALRKSNEGIDMAPQLAGGKHRAAEGSGTRPRWTRAAASSSARATPGRTR